MNEFFAVFGGKTKFFAIVAAVATSLQASGVIPDGYVEAVVAVLQAVAAAGVVFGFRDAIAKVKP
jgi:hypothetical protein